MFPNLMDTLNDSQSCFWAPNLAGTVPTKWSSNTTMSSKDYKERDRYDTHKALLEQSFGDASPFYLRQTKMMGIGVFVKKTITGADFNANHCNKLKVMYTSKKDTKEPSHSDFYANVKKQGRKKKVVEKRNLIGPAVFLNHACVQHCHCTIAQRSEEDEQGNVQYYVKMRNADLVEFVKDDEDDVANQMFLHYGNEFDDLGCPICDLENDN